MDSAKVYLFNCAVTKNKTIPLQYDTIVKIALLYFPELDNIKVRIRVKKQASPLTARPSISAFFRKASKRKYIITISNKTDSKFSAILLSNLSFNAQIGVIGHELSHINDYNKRYGTYFLKLLFMHLSKNKIDQFEYNTDLRCIEHGLGYQLLSWSKEVRLKLNLIQWKGIKHLNEQGRERYMNPESIMKAIDQNQIYK
ncbi:MAG: hypothetical protein H0U95_02245 [Bacteroidetes bacterium]|nr:hypothetical protein [Bacteroidota bacterium]